MGGWRATLGCELLYRLLFSLTQCGVCSLGLPLNFYGDFKENIGTELQVFSWPSLHPPYQLLSLSPMLLYHWSLTTADGTALSITSSWNKQLSSDFGQTMLALEDRSLISLTSSAVSWIGSEGCLNQIEPSVSRHNSIGARLEFGPGDINQPSALLSRTLSVQLEQLSLPSLGRFGCLGGQRFSGGQ